jgi:DNA-binding NarL/FixJ family response regulator
MHLHEDTRSAPRHSTKTELRLLLVDHYRMLTEALAARLSAVPDMWVAGCYRVDDPQLPEIAASLRPDVILVDATPLRRELGESVVALLAAWPPARLVVMSGDRDIAHAVAAARAGAVAWVSKDQGADELETVLRGVSRGYAWFPPEILGAILRELRDDVRRARQDGDPLQVLSPRERDVLASMAQGRRGRQIASDLMISNDTVRTHTRSIFSKLDVHSRLEAVRVARAAGLGPRGLTGGGNSAAVPIQLGQPPSGHRPRF